MGFWKSVRENLSKKIESSADINPMAQKALQKPTLKRIITQTVPVRYLVAKKNCHICQGKGNLAIELEGMGKEVPCMCLKIKQAKSRKWSRRYWSVLKTVESKEVAQEVLVTEEQAKTIDEKEKKSKEVKV